MVKLAQTQLFAPRIPSKNSATFAAPLCLGDPVDQVTAGAESGKDRIPIVQLSLNAAMLSGVSGFDTTGHIFSKRQKH